MALRTLGSVALLAAAAVLGSGCPDTECVVGDTYPCYPADAGTQGVGECRPGTYVCSARGTPGECVDAVLPRLELCDGRDNDCNGQIDEGVTNACGGCSVLGAAPGEACGNCLAWKCAGSES